MSAELMTDERLVQITRVFDAPRELVFKAWTDTAHLMSWFAPRGCTILFRKFDFRQDGGFHSCIRPPNGHDCWCKGVYLEVSPPERIVFTMEVADENGHSAEPTEVGMDPEWPRETTVTVTFADVAGKTKLTLHQTVRESLAKRTGAYPSWLQMLDRLAEMLG